MKTSGNMTGCIVALAAMLAARAQADPQNGMIGINVLLSAPANDNVLADLDSIGQVLDVIPEIHAVTVRARASDLRVIQALPYVAAANLDTRCYPTIEGGPTVLDFASGTNLWNLDAINVTDFESGRIVDFSGEGVYIAVIDSGLPYNWREYYPEERIDTQHAVGFFGGGGQTQGTVTTQPQTWEHDTFGHGNSVIGVILGFHCASPVVGLDTDFNGVAPGATVIPVKVHGESNASWWSVIARATVYAANLKINGDLGNAPLVINMSFGGAESDVLQMAAIDYAISHGIIVVAAAGNEGADGMLFPGRYVPVISVANAGWVRQFPPDDPTVVLWSLRDISEADATQYFISPDSSRERWGEELDLTAPGWAIAGPETLHGQVDYNFSIGTSLACPHVAGVAALMLEKNPTLTQPQIEHILRTTTLSMSPGCRNLTLPQGGPGNPPSWSDTSNVSFFDATVCWEANATGAGLLQADAALAATPLP